MRVGRLVVGERGQVWGTRLWIGVWGWSEKIAPPERMDWGYLLADLPSQGGEQSRWRA